MAKTLQTFSTEILTDIGKPSGGTVTTEHIRLSLNRGLNNIKNRLGLTIAKDRSVLDIFSSVFEVPLPTGFHQPIKPMDRPFDTDWDFTTAENFWLNRKNQMMAVDALAGTKFLLVRDTGGVNLVLHSCDSFDGNGTWAADISSSDATNVSTDSVTKQVGAGSINFDVDVSQSGNDYAALSVSDMNSLDLTDYLNRGTAFMRLFIPDAANVTSVTLRWGSSASAYYETTVTANYSGVSLRTGWNRLGFTWPTSTTGSPDITAINHLYVRVTYSSSQSDDTDFRIDDIMMAKPVQKELAYYSQYLVQTSASVLQGSFINTDDVSLLDDEDDDVLYWWGMYQSLKRLKDRQRDAADARVDYERGLQTMIMKHGTDRKRPVKKY